jgi:hypothetical protein
MINGLSHFGHRTTSHLCCVSRERMLDVFDAFSQSSVLREPLTIDVTLSATSKAARFFAIGITYSTVFTTDDYKRKLFAVVREVANILYTLGIDYSRTELETILDLNKPVAIAPAATEQADHVDTSHDGIFA